jgi:AmmeMemoRadiSam system protein B
MRWLGGVAFALLLAGGAAAQPFCPEGDAPFAPFYHEPGRIGTALNDAQAIGHWPAPVSGVIVPHHLEAAHLIAGGLRQASAGQGHDRVILLFPDHFGSLATPFGTTARAFDTVMGAVPAMPDGAATLLSAAGLVSDSCLFAYDHGLRAVLPFVAALMPGVPVLPVAVSVNSTPDNWAALADALVPLVTPGTLIVQSTDFSHYLPHHLARVHDQQVLNLLAARDMGQIARLVQPDHLDSLGSLAVNMMVQDRVFGAAPVVVASENMQEYHLHPIAETTSYIVAHFTPPDAPAGPPLHRGAQVYMLAGDMFLGRIMPRALSDDLVADRVAAAALAVTRGLPLVVNLEGVVLPELPGNLPELVLGMPRDLVLDWLSRLNVAGVGLANNHAMDMGPSGLAETLAALAAAEVPHAAQGERLDLPGVAIVALTDLDNRKSPPRGRLTRTHLDALLVEDARLPVVAFVHWGLEYDPAPTPRELALAEAMRQRGVAAIIGAHPHVASGGIVALGGGDVAMAYSLGNFLFDQRDEVASGAVVELWVFPQGTVFLRQLPLPNLFEVARQAHTDIAKPLR